MTDLSYRIATPQDASKIVELVNSAYRGDSSRQGWTTEADLLDGQRTDDADVIEMIESPNKIFLLCLKGEELLGSVQLTHQNDNCYLGMFTVRPKLQGSGIGKSFIQAAENFAAKDWHCKTMSMSVIAQRPELIAFYERRGYEKTGLKVEFPYGDERFGIPKRQDIYMIELKKNL